MLMTSDEFVGRILRPTLSELAAQSGNDKLKSKASERLLFMTAAHESRLKWREQIGGGPALGIYQIEPDTYHDLDKNWLEYRSNYRGVVNGALGSFAPEYSLKNRDKFATIVARLQYWRQPEALPDASDIEGLADYAKKYWNTHKGKATALDYECAWYDFRGEQALGD